MKRILRASARQLLRSSAERFGYEIRKAPLPGYASAPVFDLAVQYLMLRKGPALRFVQVGANDGARVDPLRRYILRHGWVGVLVEPQPDVFAALKANYAGFESRLAFENVAISDQPGAVTMYCAVGSAAEHDGASTVASMNPQVTAMQLRRKVSELRRISVPAVRLDDLVAKHGLHDLDLLQIDTEGYDWRVLQTLDLAKTAPRLIQFEHGHLSPGDIAQITGRLNDCGYSLYFGGHQADSLAMRGDLLPADAV